MIVYSSHDGSNGEISTSKGNQIAERISELFDRQCRFAGINR